MSRHFGKLLQSGSALRSTSHSSIVRRSFHRSATLNSTLAGSRIAPTSLRRVSSERPTKNVMSARTDHERHDDDGAKVATTTRLVDQSTRTTARCTVAIVGRPNVGKSTLFNRLTSGKRKALVSAVAGASLCLLQRVSMRSCVGTTRDVAFGQAAWAECEFDVMDTGGIVYGDKETLQAGKK
jgi:tRNA U34 5-carboxymethylaminomethyl modifying GTPase MnmE/TrmE